MRTADYEKSEKVAIDAGKEALREVPWLYGREHPLAKGSFVELRKNDGVHPHHYSVHCVDGVGTKLILSAWSGNYERPAIDAIAMNANDMATVIHAYPDTVTLYFATQNDVREQHMGAIMTGFRNALEKIRIPNAPFSVNIGKIETASLDEMVESSVEGKGWDVGVSLTGFIEKDKVPNLNPQPGHVIVGVSSTGLHSNGFTAARHVLLTPDVEYREKWKSQYTGKFGLNDMPPILEGQTVLEALQTPTALYIVEAALIGQEFDDPDIYGVNITGNGLHNFNRVGKEVAFEIIDPFEPLPIHELLMQVSRWDIRTAYKKHNMGMGFAYVVPDESIANKIVSFINQRGEHTAKIVGRITHNKKATPRTTLHVEREGAVETLDFDGYTN